MTVRQLEYPNVECDEHPGRIEPGYMVCRHILHPDDVAHIEEASPARLGVVACARCYRLRHDRNYVLDNFMVCCAPGLREHGLLVRLQ